MMSRVYTTDELINYRETARKEGKKVVFTNGCFDIIHRGHIELLERSKKLGDVLIIGLNTDASVKKLKGEERPLVNQDDRAYIIASLKCVDAVCLFDEDTPAELIEKIKPDILVKGGDYKIEEVVGRETVWDSGGEVITIPLIEGKSTRVFIERILELYRKKQ
ncbi:unnamed protein product [marine sediment metagenome]|uniref:D-glycero-beta-D-manno-heptose 1-phosphate adenylyltransferase n=1 Tax=marine sediment metagenome TaxID=412755 RepID=X0UT58_9ZZZZ